MLYEDGFFGGTERARLKKGMEYLLEAIHAEQPHAVAYAAGLFGEHAFRPYLFQQQDILEQQAQKLQIPPQGPLPLPVLPWAN